MVVLGNIWTGTVGLGSGAPYQQTWDATQYHTVSLMWGTAAKNGGTGYLKRYLDRVLLAGGTFTWTPGDPGSALDAQQMMLILCSGVDLAISGGLCRGLSVKSPRSQWYSSR